MAQNTSSAVMQQRVEAHDSLDDFPTPPWATRALIEHVIMPFLPMSIPKMETVAEPCANRGYMVKPLLEYFENVIASDVMDYGAGYEVRDYLFPGPLPAAEWTIANPPFVVANDFLFRSFETPGWLGTALLVRSAFLEGTERYETIYRDNPPTIYAQFSERVIMHKGILRDPDRPYWDVEEQKWKRPSTATSYCWLVWVKNADRQPTTWIPPCRKLLTLPGDYPEPEGKPADDTNPDLFTTGEAE